MTLPENQNVHKDIWIDKIYKDILNDDAKPIEWAKQISEYLHNDAQLWKLDLSILSVKKPPSKGPTGTIIYSRTTDKDETLVKKSIWQVPNRRQSEPARRETTNTWTNYQVINIFLTY